MAWFDKLPFSGVIDIFALLLINAMKREHRSQSVLVFIENRVVL